MSINRYMGRENVAYIQWNTVKKVWNFATGSNLDGLGRHYAK